MLKLDYRTVTALALLMALLMHYGLLQTLRYTPGVEKPPKAVHEQPIVTAIAVPGSPFEWQNEIYEWARLADPTLIALPSYDLGFANVLLRETLRPNPHFPGYQARVEMQPERQSELPELKTAALNIVFPGLPIANLPNLADNGVARQPFPKNIIWRTELGKPIEQMPRQLPANLVESGAAEYPDNTTIIEIQRLADQVRLRLTQSCGNEELDNFALRLVGKRAAIDEAKAVLGEAPQKSSFFPDSQTVKIIEVEWRLALGNDQ